MSRSKSDRPKFKSRWWRVDTLKFGNKDVNVAFLLSITLVPNLLFHKTEYRLFVINYHYSSPTNYHKHSMDNESLFSLNLCKRSLSITFVRFLGWYVSYSDRVFGCLCTRRISNKTGTTSERKGRTVEEGYRDLCSTHGGRMFQG